MDLRWQHLIGNTSSTWSELAEQSRQKHPVKSLQLDQSGTNNLKNLAQTRDTQYRPTPPTKNERLVAELGIK